MDERIARQGTLAKTRKNLDRLLADFRLSKEQVKREKHTLQAAKQSVQDALEAQEILQSIAEDIQSRAHQRIASIVTRCLEAVFPDPYQFKVKFHKKRGKTEAELLLVRDGLEVYPLDATGGGVVDVVGFALRLACLALSQPRRRKLLVLDEPFRCLSQEYIPFVGEMLVTLCKELDLQIIAVTHNRNLRVGKVVEIGE